MRKFLPRQSIILTMVAMAVGVAAFIFSCGSRVPAGPGDSAKTSGYEAVVDHLAADPASARYRTGTPDPAVERLPLYFDSLVVSEPRAYLPQLAEYLRFGAENDFQVVKRIHDWIIAHVAYEFSAETDPIDLLSSCRTNCVGYADLFRLLANYAGIRAETVIGYSRTYIFNGGRQGDHAWSIAWIEGRGYFVDTTHDARLRVRDNVVVYRRAYADDELFLKPEWKFSINFPLDTDFQLLSPVRSYAAYMDQPRVRLGFFRYGLSFDDAAFLGTRYLKNTPISVAGISGISDAFDAGALPARLSLSVPPGVQVRATLQPGTVNEFAPVSVSEEPAKLMPETEGNRATFVFPAIGETGWRVTLEARYVEASMWESVYSFYLAHRLAALTAPDALITF